MRSDLCEFFGERITNTMHLTKVAFQGLKEASKFYFSLDWMKALLAILLSIVA